jgi:hypothetical protein
MKLLLVALILSMSVNANMLPLNSAEAPMNRMTNALKMLLPATALLQKEMLEASRDLVLEKIQKFWENLRGIYKNTGSLGETPSGTPPSRGGNSPVQSLSQSNPTSCSGATANIQTIRYEDGRVYQGSVRNEQPWGFGEMQYPDGTRYVGGWRDGLQEGEVTTFYPSHRLIESQRGLWRDGTQEQILDTQLRQGVIRVSQGYYLGPVNSRGEPDTATEDYSEEQPAILEYIYGHVYVGEFANGSRFGAGTITYQDGSIYKGQWMYDQKDGEGVLTLADGTQIQAIWQEGQIDNDAVTPVVSYRDGRIYRGSLSKDYWLHGDGMMSYQNGSWIRAVWDFGRELEGKAFLIYEDGSIYQGETFAGVPDGEGSLFEDGIWTAVSMENGEVVGILLDFEQQSSAVSPQHSRANSVSNSCDTSFDNSYYQRL